MQERLQKIIAAAGVTSRRKAEELIRQGLVSVNGRVVTELGSKADPEKDHIRVSGKLLRQNRELLYILLNKPAGVVSTASDPQGRPTVISLLHKRGITQRVYPVGRLDYASTGLILITNDGDLANRLMSRSSAVPRTYHVKVEGVPDAKAIQRIESGIVLDGRKTAPARVRPAGKPGEKSWHEITLIEGRYHQVRRMFERVGHPVVKLKRVRIAFLTSEGMAPGEFRRLTAEEVRRLKSGSAGSERESRGRPARPKTRGKAAPAHQPFAKRDKFKHE